MLQDHELLSRFRGVYLVGLPDEPSRYTLLQTLLRELHHSLTDDDIRLLAQKTQGSVAINALLLRVKLLRWE